MLDIHQHNIARTLWYQLLVRNDHDTGMLMLTCHPTGYINPERRSLCLADQAGYLHGGLIQQQARSQPAPTGIHFPTLLPWTLLAIHQFRFAALCCAIWRPSRQCVVHSAMGGQRLSLKLGWACPTLTCLARFSPLSPVLAATRQHPTVIHEHKLRNLISCVYLI